MNGFFLVGIMHEILRRFLTLMAASSLLIMAACDQLQKVRVASSQTVERGIINGQTTRSTEFPEVLIIAEVVGLTIKSKCTAIVFQTGIWGTRLLTAAHCVKSAMSSPSNLWVGRTFNDILYNTPIAVGSRIVLNDGYSDSNIVNGIYQDSKTTADLAVVILDRVLSITPATINYNQLASGTLVSFVGFGQDGNAGSPTLKRKGTLAIDSMGNTELPNHNLRLVDNIVDYFSGTINTNLLNMNGFYHMRAAPSQACVGDSGGPSYFGGQVVSIQIAAPTLCTGAGLSDHIRLGAYQTWLESTKLLRPDCPSNQGAVKGFYADALQRIPTSTDLANWLNSNNNLKTGLTRKIVASAIVNSLEYRTNTVNRIYRQFLNRSPSQAELDSGLTLIADQGEQVFIAQLIREQEYVDRAKLNYPNSDENKSFVAQAFYDLLGRKASSTDIDHWYRVIYSQIAAYYGREEAAKQIMAGGEYRIYRVATMYKTYLRRPTDSAGENYWVGQLGTRRLEDVMSDIMASREYYDFH